MIRWSAGELVLPTVPAPGADSRDAAICPACDQGWNRTTRRWPR
ncbi:hypothetical protein FRAHR75_1150012 [Frankia sp. Hr75.2]|nr:hypothetical protein FRAHR75_1150012 [Frankia sp. Hr75.2]